MGIFIGIYCVCDYFLAGCSDFLALTVSSSVTHLLIRPIYQTICLKYNERHTMEITLKTK